MQQTAVVAFPGDLTLHGKDCAFAVPLTCKPFSGFDTPQHFAHATLYAQLLYAGVCCRAEVKAHTVQQT